MPADDSFEPSQPPGIYNAHPRRIRHVARPSRPLPDDQDSHPRDQRQHRIAAPPLHVALFEAESRLIVETRVVTSPSPPPFEDQNELSPPTLEPQLELKEPPVTYLEKMDEALDAMFKLIMNGLDRIQNALKIAL